MVSNAASTGWSGGGARADQAQHGQRGDTEPVGPLRPDPRLVDQRFADVEHDGTDGWWGGVTRRPVATAGAQIAGGENAEADEQHASGRDGHWMAVEDERNNGEYQADHRKRDSRRSCRNRLSPTGIITMESMVATGDRWAISASPAPGRRGSGSTR